MYIVKISVIVIFLSGGACNKKVSSLELEAPQLPSPKGELSLTEINLDNLKKHLLEMSGYTTVSIDGKSMTVKERYSPASKAIYRKLWLSYFQELNIPAIEISYKTRFDIGESEGHNLEAVLKGKTADSIVVLVHYDSIGSEGRETENPGVDDNMTGMAIMLEAARLLVAKQESLHYTVRFVATDYEEEGLEGANAYAVYLKNKSKNEKFRIVAAIGPDQTGWNCIKDDKCEDDSKGMTFDVYSCSDDDKNYDANIFGDIFDSFVRKYSSFQVERDCNDASNDTYAFWEIGVPAFVVAEHNPGNNENYDAGGKDTFDTIDFEYYSEIAKILSAFIARLAGIAVVE